MHQLWYGMHDRHELVRPAPNWPNNKPYALDVVAPVSHTVAADGSTSEVQIEAPAGADFDALASDVAKRWTFQPAISEGKTVGGALEFTVKPSRWFLSCGSATYTQAAFTQSDSLYRAGDKLPYVPEVISCPILPNASLAQA